MNPFYGKTTNGLFLRLPARPLQGVERAVPISDSAMVTRAEAILAPHGLERASTRRIATQPVLQMEEFP